MAINGNMLSRILCRRVDGNLNSQFNAFFKSDKLNDVTIVCEGTHVRLHRMILCLYSTFFNNIITNNDTNCTCNNLVIAIPFEIKLKYFNILIEFIYRGEVIIEETDLRALRQTASLLGINFENKYLNSIIDDNHVQHVSEQFNCKQFNTEINCGDKLNNLNEFELSIINYDTQVIDNTSNIKSTINKDPYDGDLDEDEPIQLQVHTQQQVNAKEKTSNLKLEKNKSLNKNCHLNVNSKRANVLTNYFNTKKRQKCNKFSPKNQITINSNHNQYIKHETFIEQLQQQQQEQQMEIPETPPRYLNDDIDDCNGGNDDNDGVDDYLYMMSPSPPLSPTNRFSKYNYPISSTPVSNSNCNINIYSSKSMNHHDTSGQLSYREFVRNLNK